MNETKLHRFLYLNEMSEQGKELSMKFFRVELSTRITFGIYDTFLILYVLQFISFAQLGVILAIRFGTQALLDYPTGALADLLGHKKVLLISYSLHIAAIGILLFNTSFQGILFSYTISAIAFSQESGALISWFDNRYSKDKEYDPEKKIYGAFFGKLQTISTIAMGSAFIIGGLIAEIYSRELLFIIHLIGLIVTTYLIIKQLDGNASDAPKLSSSSYKAQLTSGFSYLKNNPGINILFIGIAINSSIIWAVWGNLMLYPTYNAYGGTDQLTGAIRATIFMLGAGWTVIASSLSKKISRTYMWIILTNMLTGTFFFTAMYLYQENVSPRGGGYLPAIVGLILIFQMVSISMAFGDILFRRVMIELVPNEIRNTVYSLLPSMITLFGIPAALLGGWAITNIGFVPSLLIVGSLSTFGIIIMGLGFYIHSGRKIQTKTRQVVGSEIPAIT